MGLTYAVAVHAARILQGLQGGGGLTFTEQLPASNSSSNATAVFPTQSPTATYNTEGSAVAVTPSVSTYGGSTNAAGSAMAMSWSEMLFAGLLAAALEHFL